METSSFEHEILLQYLPKPIRTTILFITHDNTDATLDKEAEAAITNSVSMSHVVRLPLAEVLRYISMGIYDVVVLWTDQESDDEISALANRLKKASHPENDDSEHYKVKIVVFSARQNSGSLPCVNARVEQPNVNDLAMIVSLVNLRHD